MTTGSFGTLAVLKVNQYLSGCISSIQILTHLCKKKHSEIYHPIWYGTIGLNILRYCFMTREKCYILLGATALYVNINTISKKTHSNTTENQGKPISVKRYFSLLVPTFALLTRFLSMRHYLPVCNQLSSTAVTFCPKMHFVDSQFNVMDHLVHTTLKSITGRFSWPTTEM